MRFRIIAALTVLVAVTLVTAACGSSTSPSSVGSIAVTGIAPAVGATSQLTATATLSDGTTQDVTSSATWLASDPTVVTVSATGVVTGIGPGTTSVFATVGAVTGSLQLTVASGQ